MESLLTLNANNWQNVFSADLQSEAINAIENGKVVYFPSLPFSLGAEEQKYIDPSYANPKSKNISFNLHADQINGVVGNYEDQVQIKKLLQRFSLQSQSLMQTLFPHYRLSLQTGRTSFRPVEIDGRVSSYRKDDTRLHVDAFPSSPNQGKRIIRVFSNINPHGKARLWRVGEPFAQVARNFLPQINKPFPGVNILLKNLRITKTKRSHYDHIMLRMHDLMKSDLTYQKNVSQTEIAFPPGSSWIVMTDQVSHAAMSGQHVLEQTFYLPIAAMQDEQRSPLRILERLTKQKLV